MITINNGVITLDDVGSTSPGLGEYTRLRDTSGTALMIPNKLIVRLYGMLEFTAQRQGVDFPDWCNGLFKGRSS